MRRACRALLRLALVLWAGFWAWFVIAASLGEPPPPPWWIPAAWLAGLGALVLLAWRRPAVGGLALAAAALASAVEFDRWDTRALLALPALALGLGFLALAWTGRRMGGAGGAALALLALALSIAGCRAPQDPADLPFETASILRHADGSLRRARLLEETELGGLACRRWVWWHADGALDNVELARDSTVQGHALPAETRVFFDREGKLAHAWLSQDTVVDGHPCRGRWKIDTAFHPNGRVRAFFPPHDVEIDGVPCDASVFHPVYLHPDGRLARCRLARAFEIGGERRAAGSTIELDERGEIATDRAASGR
jgi:hypothetical protein